MKRRKGRRRPPTVPVSCAHLIYVNGRPKCGLKRRGQCDKTRGCGYEEDCNKTPFVEETLDRLG